MKVSINGGTPKYLKWMIWGYPYFRKPPNLAMQQTIKLQWECPGPNLRLPSGDTHLPAVPSRSGFDTAIPPCSAPRPHWDTPPRGAHQERARRTIEGSKFRPHQRCWRLLVSIQLWAYSKHLFWSISVFKTMFLSEYISNQHWWLIFSGGILWVKHSIHSIQGGILWAFNL